MTAFTVTIRPRTSAAGAPAPSAMQPVAQSSTAPPTTIAMSSTAPPPGIALSSTAPPTTIAMSSTAPPLSIASELAPLSGR